MDYREMYLKLMDATENAIEQLVAAQREVEELYLAAGERENADA